VGGEEEGIRAHPFEALAGLGEDGKGVAGGRQYGGGMVARGNRAMAWERRKGVEHQLQEYRGKLLIGRRRYGRGTRARSTAAARAGGGRRVAAREWAGKPRDRVGEEIRRRMGVRGRKGAALTGRDSRNGGGGGVEQKK
jgi:hypothetical protein